MTVLDVARMMVCAAITIIVIHSAVELVTLMGRHAATVFTRLSLILFAVGMFIEQAGRIDTGPVTWRLGLNTGAVACGFIGIIVGWQRKSRRRG